MSLHLSPGVMDVAFLVVFASFFSLALVTYAVRVRLGLSTLPPLRPRGAGRRLLPALLVGYFYWLTKPICRLAIRSGQSASFFTVLGLVLAFATAIAVGAGHFADFPAHRHLQARTRLVFEVERRNLDLQPAPQPIHHDSAQLRLRKSLEAGQGLRGRYVGLG